MIARKRINVASRFIEAVVSSPQEARIERQKSLITSLEVDGHTAWADAARQVLTEMAILLTHMQDDLTLAEQRLMAREGR
jgi:hypothetical protein